MGDAEHPTTHIQLIDGTAGFSPTPGRYATEIGVERSTWNLVFRAMGAVRRALDNFSDQTVAGAKTFTSTTTFSGAAALNGTATFTGTAAFTGATTGLRAGSTAIEAGETRLLTAAESGAVMLCTAASGTQVFTLPAAATAGLRFTFVCGAGAAGGEIHVGVATGDNIIGKTHGAENGTGLVSTVTTGLLKNTAGNNVVGDFTTLVSDGATTYYMVAVAGVWSVT